VDDKVFDIRAKQLEQASPILQKALVELYDKYNLDICLTLMMWWSAKAVVYSGLTEKEMDSMIEKCKKSLDTCYAVIQNLKNNQEPN
jgi:hypothetical protein